MDDAAKDSTVLRASSGGVGAKKLSRDLLCAFNCLATSLDRYRGFMSSPLFASTHRTDMAFLPVLALASFFSFFVQTPFPQKYFNSLRRASLTSESLRTCPVMSSRDRPLCPCSGPCSDASTSRSSVTAFRPTSPLRMIPRAFISSIIPRRMVTGYFAFSRDVTSAFAP